MLGQGLSNLILLTSLTFDLRYIVKWNLKLKLVFLKYLNKLILYYTTYNKSNKLTKVSYM